MQSELDRLAKATADLAAAATGRQELESRAGRLAERLERGRFNVSVLGEFKRGKSTLINAILGVELMPTGVLPLTAVATEVGFGPGGATVVHLDGSEEEVGLEDLADYVTEAGNPGNQRQVARVEARAPVELLRPGVVLVDTPGIGSVFRHDEAAARALLEADGAILVLSADAPMSEEERKLLSALSERQAPTFFVLNRVDHLNRAERGEVAKFVTDAVAADLGRKERLWCVSARAALGARLVGEAPDEDEAGDFAAFYEDFRRFIDEDLVEARVETARGELSRLAHEIDDSLSIEAATADLDAATLADRVSRLRAAAADQRQAFEDERTLLQRDVNALAHRIEVALADFAAQEPNNCDRRLVEVARATPVRQLEDSLRRTVESAVRESFESFRQAEAAQAEESWRELAERFRDRTQERVNAVRAAAADIFQVKLPELTVPQVAEERERYFYLFLHVGSSTENIDRALRRLLPPALRRRRSLERARHDLASEFDKHAGRARWDLTQRLDAVRRRFEVAMAAELERSVTTILEATARAEELRSMAELEREAHRQVNDTARRAADAALAAADNAGRPSQGGHLGNVR
ncbi:MAG TPA: dynamin family protein [Acidimicrobiales bacterium]|nr:dynamin family protein [Acidimicrobiales bacterium]